MKFRGGASYFNGISNFLGGGFGAIDPTPPVPGLNLDDQYYTIQHWHRR